MKISFLRKARIVARGYQTAPLLSATYSLVVSRENIRITFLVVALNNLDIMMLDIKNAYLMAPVTETIYNILRPELSKNEGNTGVIVREIYGLKLSWVGFRKFFAETLMDLGFRLCLVDADMWCKPATTKMGSFATNMCWYM